MKYNQTGFRSNFEGGFRNHGSGSLKREVDLLIAKISLLMGAFVGLIISFFKKE